MIKSARAKIVKPWPKHIRRRVDWWCVTRKGTLSGNGLNPKDDRAEAFRLRDAARERGEDATVYEVTVSYKARRVEKRR